MFLNNRILTTTKNVKNLLYPNNGSYPNILKSTLKKNYHPISVSDISSLISQNPIHRSFSTNSIPSDSPTETTSNISLTNTSVSHSKQEIHIDNFSTTTFTQTKESNSIQHSQYNSAKSNDLHTKSFEEPPRSEPSYNTNPHNDLDNPLLITNQDKEHPLLSEEITINADPSELSTDEEIAGIPLRSRTYLVETIHGRSRRWFFDSENDKLLHQWMWLDDEDEFDRLVQSNKSSSNLVNRIRSFTRNSYSRLRAVFHSTLLPSGFPDSVHPCYVSFSLWQFVETAAGSVAHVLCSQAMLSSVGLPTSVGAVAGGAVAIRWIVKDGLAHFAKLAFTKRFAYAFDYKPKTWGVWGEIMLVIGSAFELSTAYAAAYGFPGLFIPLAAIGASLQSVAHLAWEATHANFIRGLALRNNIADVTAKADSQMVVSDLIGLGIGVTFISEYHEPHHLLSCFAICVPIHWLCTFGRLNSIRFGMISESRALQLFNSYIRHHAGPIPLEPKTTPADALASTGIALPTSLLQSKDMDAMRKHMEATVLTVQGFSSDTSQKSSNQSNLPATMSTIGHKTQSVLALASPDQCHLTDVKFGEWFNPQQWTSVFGYSQVKVGVTINEAFRTETEMYGSVSLFVDELYLLTYNETLDTIFIIFEEDAADDTVLMAFMHATKLAYDIKKIRLGLHPLLDKTTKVNSDRSQWDPHGIIKESFQWTKSHIDPSKALLEDAGWDTEMVVWGDLGNRVYWDEPEPLTNSMKNNYLLNSSMPTVGMGVSLEEVPSISISSPIRPASRNN